VIGQIEIRQAHLGERIGKGQTALGELAELVQLPVPHLLQLQRLRAQLVRLLC
jgi:hypothetical protein